MPHRLMVALLISLLLVCLLIPVHAENPVMEVHQLMLGCAD